MMCLLMCVCCFMEVVQETNTSSFLPLVNFNVAVHIKYAPNIDGCHQTIYMDTIKI